MKNLDIYGEPGFYRGSYKDPGNHNGQRLELCPFCGGRDLEVCNTNSAAYSVRCNTCAVEKYGEVVEWADDSETEQELMADHQKAFQSAVDGWNTRAR